MVKIIDNCCSTAYLDCLKQVASNSENWTLKYPNGKELEDKFPKLEIIVNGMFKDPFVSGLALGLILQIHERVGQELFFPEINTCGISIKDNHSSGDNMHIDEGGNGEKGSELFVKVVGLLNSDWQEEWGGGLFCDETSYYAKPTSFYIFDPSIPHMSEEIVTDKKRLAIDFTVFKDQQSRELYYEIPHYEIPQG